MINNIETKRTISKLKNELAKSDYKVIKNQEAKEAGQPFVYEPIALYEERQALRRQINELERVIESELKG